VIQIGDKCWIIVDRSVNADPQRSTFTVMVSLFVRDSEIIISLLNHYGRKETYSTYFQIRGGQRFQTSETFP